MYAVYAAVSGASAGRDSWYFYAVLGSGEALIRLAATLAAVVLSWHLLGFESAIIALLVLAGNLAIALNMHRLYVSGWVCAATLALLLLYVPLDVVSRTELALGAAPLCGFTVILVGILRSPKAESRKSTDKSGLFQDALATRHERS